MTNYVTFITYSKMLIEILNAKNSILLTLQKYLTQ